MLAAAVHDEITATALCCWCGSALVPTGASFICPRPFCAQRQRNWQVENTRDGVIYLPTPRQVEFHESITKHTLFGGAAGPGKSHALRWDVYTRCLRQPGYEALLLRRTFPELEKTHIRKA